MFVSITGMCYHIGMSEYEVAPLTALKFRMEQMGVSQNEFARRIGMQHSHFSEVMNGKRRLPLDAIRKAVELGCPSTVLLKPFPCEEINDTTNKS